MDLELKTERNDNIYLVAFIFAFCSITYELILGQTLSAFLGNTVLRYSVTIALYMAAMGVGAFWAEERFIKRPALTLLKAEFLLIFCGGLCIIHLHCFNFLWHESPFLFGLFAHLLIIAIGVLTGLELPLLMEMRGFQQKKNENENFILGINYSGAFLGTVVFAFLCYPVIGLMKSAFLAGLLNAFAAVLFINGIKNSDSEIKRGLFGWRGIHSTLLLLFFLAFLKAQDIDHFFMSIYLSL